MTLQMKTYLFLLSFVILPYLLPAQSELDSFLKDDIPQQQKIEENFLQKVDFSGYKDHLKTITRVPHIVGSKANEEVRDYLTATMEKAGWKVSHYPFDVYLPKDPGTSSVEIVTPERKPLNQMEYVLESDPFSDHPDLKKGWNAYSGSGDVTAEIVYANYGTKADFEKMKALGVIIEGKIVLARYGGNFRGYKAKFAEQNGAVGLLIFTDPGDSGYAKGLVYPDGTYYNESAVQRGSLITENFTGDPLTPFEPALPLDGKTKVERLDPSDTQLPKIPVTPIPYGSAEEILSQMEGNPVPVGWQGGLPFTYRLEGGPKLTVRLMVEQPADFVRINNVVGILEGSKYPDEWVILGCHYDAWSFGATDPNSGTAMLLTLSEALGRLSDEGYPPERSILIAHWDGEEHGVIGSTEWVEQMQEELMGKGVAYLNFDAGVSGRNIGGSAAPSLKKTMMNAAKMVQFPDSSKTLFEVWSKGKEQPSIGNLGGGSDHIGFYMHVGVPSLSGGAGGPTLYHTNYDNFHFYEKFVDPSFKMGGAVAQWAGIMALRLSNASVIPYQVSRYAEDLKAHFENAEEKIRTFQEDFKGFERAEKAIQQLNQSSEELESILNEVLNDSQLTPDQRKNYNEVLLELEKSFLYQEGMPFGNWYRSLYASTDPNSGYASWILPAIQFEIENQSVENLDQWDQVYGKAIENLNQKVLDLKGIIAP